MATLLRCLTTLLVSVPALAVGWFAFQHFLDGLALDSAIPVPTLMIRQMPLSTAAYRYAERSLARTDPSDGDAQIAAADAAMHAGPSAKSQVARLRAALGQAPASSRGWVLLSEALFATNHASAASALSQGLLLAPYDYWLSGLRAQVAAAHWDDLDADTRDMALRQTRSLWEEDSLRDWIRPLLSSNAGVVLLVRAFAGRPDDLRALNRWVSQNRRRSPSAP